MKWAETFTLNLDQSGAEKIVPTGGASWVTVQARLVKGATWGAAVLKVMGSSGDTGAYFDEPDGGARLSAEGTTRRVDVSGYKRVKVKVHASSSTAGTIVEVSVCLHNPNGYDNNPRTGGI